MSLHTNMLQKRSHILSFNAKSRWHTNLPSTRIHQPRSQNRIHQTIVSGIIKLHGRQAFSGWIPPLIMSPSLQIHTSCRITSFHSKGQSVCMHRSRVATSCPIVVEKKGHLLSSSSHAFFSAKIQNLFSFFPQRMLRVKNCSTVSRSVVSLLTCPLVTSGIL